MQLTGECDGRAVAMHRPYRLMMPTRRADADVAWCEWVMFHFLEVGSQGRREMDELRRAEKRRDEMRRAVRCRGLKSDASTGSMAVRRGVGSGLSVEKRAHERQQKQIQHPNFTNNHTQNIRPSHRTCRHITCSHSTLARTNTHKSCLNPPPPPSPPNWMFLDDHARHNSVSPSVSQTRSQSL